MASVGALGIGLSIVFGVFLVLLLAELYYLLFWKRKSLRVNSVALHEPQPGSGAAAGVAGGVSESGLVAKKLESRFIVGIDGECVLAPPRFLFTIKEESREDLAESDVDALKKPKLQPVDHVVVQVFDHHPDDLRCDKPLLQLCSSSSEASSSSGSCSSSARVSEDEQLGDEEDEETIPGDIGDQHPPASAGDNPAAASDEEDVCTTPFLTPPSSPGFSTPSSSPLRITHRSSTSSSCYESPPSPPLAPMPVLGRSSSSSSGQEMGELNSSPHFTPLSCSSRDSRQ